jgi:hypothetical protein
MPLLDERSDNHGCDVPGVDERNTLSGRAVGEGTLLYFLRAAEEILHEAVFPNTANLPAC